MLDIPEIVKQQFFNDSVPKAYYIRAKTKREIFILGNSDLEKESVTFSESLCSKSKFKFGLCEDSVIKFNACLGSHKLEAGDKLSVFLDISTEGLNAGARDYSLYDFPTYRVAIGEFYVDSCVKNSDNPLSKVTAYSQISTAYNVKGQSRYLMDYPLGGNEIQFNPINHFFINTKILENGSEISGYISHIHETLTVQEWSEQNYSQAPYVSWTNTHGETYTVFLRGYVKFGASVYGNNNWTNTLYIPTGKAEYDMFVAEEIAEWHDNIADSFEYKQEICDFLDLVSDSNFHLDLEYQIVGGWGHIRDTVRIGDMTIGYPVYAYTKLTFTYTYNGNTQVIGHLNMYDSSEYTVDRLSSFWNDRTIPVEGEDVTIWDGDHGVGSKIFSSINDLDIRALMEDAIELQGLFGGMSRYGEFKLYSLLHNERLYPADTLYPDNAIYPCDESGSVTVIPSGMLKAQFEEEYVQFGGIICEYANGASSTALYQYIWDENLPVYELKDNEYLKSNVYTSTEVKTIIDPLILQLKYLVYMPAKVDMIGLPFVEKGDILYMRSRDKSVVTILLDRDLKGIQSLRDKVIAK